MDPSVITGLVGIAAIAGAAWTPKGQRDVDRERIARDDRQQRESLVEERRRMRQAAYARYIVALDVLDTYGSGYVPTAEKFEMAVQELVRALRERRGASEWHGGPDLVLPSLAGTPILPENLHRRALKPAAEEAGGSWAGFHSFRHHCASGLIAEGRNVVQVSRWLGHSPSFTLDVYAHLMDDGLGAPLDLDLANSIRSKSRLSRVASDVVGPQDAGVDSFSTGREPRIATRLR